jgi:hypothetical protein
MTTDSLATFDREGPRREVVQAGALTGADAVLDPGTCGVARRARRAVRRGCRWRTRCNATRPGSEGTSGYNVARQAVLRAGLPTGVAGMTIDRQCASGLMAVATAAKQIVADGMQITVGGGVESISLVQNEHRNVSVGGNQLLDLFLDPAERALHLGWDGTTKCYVSSLRKSVGPDTDDQRLIELIGNSPSRVRASARSGTATT